MKHFGILYSMKLRYFYLILLKAVCSPMSCLGMMLEPTSIIAVVEIYVKIAFFLVILFCFLDFNVVISLLNVYISFDEYLFDLFKS